MKPKKWGIQNPSTLKKLLKQLKFSTGESPSNIEELWDAVLELIKYNHELWDFIIENETLYWYSTKMYEMPFSTMKSGKIIKELLSKKLISKSVLYKEIFGGKK